jgi:hypothetical protein
MGTSITAADNSLSDQMQTTSDMEAKSEVDAFAPEESQNSETEEPAEWVAGFQLFVLVSVLSLVMFLVLLDSSIIGTVSECPFFLQGVSAKRTSIRLRQRYRLSLIHCQMWAGTELLTSLLGERISMT